jgi:hypothetical protein
MWSTIPRLPTGASCCPKGFELGEVFGDGDVSEVVAEGRGVVVKAVECSTWHWLFRFVLAFLSLPIQSLPY